MEMFGIVKKIENVFAIEYATGESIVEANGEGLGEVNIKREILQGDSLSPLFFVLSMVLLSLILKKINAWY